ncbi:alpha/beta hydrolase [Fischerella sp. JS2]|uniref:alpha/beta fold hydrolase n=1 Tax=Fischerella sp. JS2 TaxID=2597771 RepID=UPI0028E68687|nr:alpha/beta hydrolase [Fischerella sp. JS2]
MSKTDSHPYFFTPQSSSPEYPLLVFLPGMDETGKEMMRIQTAGLEAAFDVRCFVIPPDELTNWANLAEEVISLTQAELKKVPRTSVYLCGESFGACIALKVMEKIPEMFARFILINSASSFHRVSLLYFCSLLFPYTPNFFYQISSFIALPFLAPVNRLSPAAREALLEAVSSAPKKTAEQRLFLLREFSIDENKLFQITQPVLLIASKNDRLLPSQAEAQRLAKIFPQSRLVTLPHSGHACLVETDVNLWQILQAENFLN